MQLVCTTDDAAILIARAHNLLPSQVMIVMQDGQAIVSHEAGKPQAPIALSDLNMIINSAKNNTRLQAIKDLRQLTNCSLVEAKAFIDMIKPFVSG